MNIFTTERINQLIENYYKGYPITRTDKFFFRNQEGTLSHDILIAFTNEEKLEYAKCSNDIKYFIEKYCGVSLFNFQKEWIDDFVNNRFLIYCTSRQVGYYTTMAAVYLHYLIFNIDKNILIFCNKGCSGIEFLNKVFRYYLKIPYFLKPGIKYKNQTNMRFNNGNRIITQARSKTPSIGYTVNIMSFMDFAYIPSNIIDTFYSTVFPTVSSLSSSKVIIQSTPNGNNLFIKLLHNSERKENDPLKNLYKSIRTYWWEVPGRLCTSWKQEQINMIGSEEAFGQEYDLQFFLKNNNTKNF